MNVRVEYVAQMRQASGVGDELVGVEAPCSVRGLIDALAQRHGDRFRTIVFDAAGAVRPSLLVFVSDEQVELAEARELREGDKVTILAPLAGG